MGFALYIQKVLAGSLLEEPLALMLQTVLFMSSCINIEVISS